MLSAVLLSTFCTQMLRDICIQVPFMHVICSISIFVAANDKLHVLSINQLAYRDYVGCIAKS